MLIAPGREERPTDFAPPSSIAVQGACPFCKGNEHATPPAVREYFAPDSANEWAVRVVPNKYPAVARHEVLVESARHVSSFSELSTMEQELTLLAWRDRFREHMQQPAIHHVQIFKNVGRDGGASVQHAHSQVIPLDFAPPTIRHMNERAAQFARREGVDLLSAMTRTDQNGGRLLFETQWFSVVCPFASRFSYECRISPRVNTPPFERVNEAILADAASVLRRVVAALEAILPQPAYNVVLNTSPKNGSAESFRWFMQVFPRLTQFAGFEWATDCFINTVSPESAAEELRAALEHQSGE